MVNGKLFFTDEKNWEQMIKNGHPKSVEVMARYLVERGIKMNVYKSIFRSEYILVVNNITCTCKSAREVMEILKGRFLAEKEKEEAEYWQKVVRKELTL